MVKGRKPNQPLLVENETHSTNTLNIKSLSQLLANNVTSHSHRLVTKKAFVPDPPPTKDMRDTCPL